MFRLRHKRLWNKNFPYIKRLNVPSDIPSLDEAHLSLPATYEVERYPPSALLLAPVLEVCRDAKWRVARYELNNRRLLLGKHLSEDFKRALIADKYIELAHLSISLNVFNPSGHARNIASSIM